VLLLNTYDYPVYSLAAEKVKAAFRIAYSVLDKIAYFLNAYLDLGLSERGISFPKLFKTRSKAVNFREAFAERKNWMLRGLYWVSRDLYDPGDESRELLEPDAQELHKLRRFLEHRYVKLHDPFLPSTGSDAHRDQLAFSIKREEFEEKAVRMLRTVREATIYLSLAIELEERQKAEAREDDVLVMPIPSTTIADDWKM